MRVTVVEGSVPSTGEREGGLIMSLYLNSTTGLTAAPRIVPSLLKTLIIQRRAAR